MIKKSFLISLVGIISILMMPNFSSAVATTATELQAQINALMTQIQALQTQLTQVQGTTVQWCHDFNVNLKYGDSGEEVYSLQTALIKEGFSVGNDEQSKKYFGEMTASAVSGFQQKYADEILTPLGLKYGTGYVGKSTRAKLNQLYGCSSVLISNNDSIPSPVPTPTDYEISCILKSPLYTATAYGKKTDGKIQYKGITQIGDKICNVAVDMFNAGLPGGASDGWTPLLEKASKEGLGGAALRCGGVVGGQGVASWGMVTGIKGGITAWARTQMGNYTTCKAYWPDANCKTVQTFGYNPNSGICMAYNTPCDVPVDFKIANSCIPCSQNPSVLCVQ